ncbi:NADPH-dependent FMN reductase [Paenibacillus mucilaginosus 3016]|uniref:NADPH-dependent FMN reductase n=1 Tax=Paenibacillus mucilaginosus 3016 TaxID=1116391 RepID=H6NCD6_9BACL|nr:NADPH-dependent FMN reductase [Paenibacillus mucilaginosus]AFC28549.1 NADPH-dependent FMN reductase [Paenibacillus mucilaginosus 3016]WFA17337.1 NAD(P)H-dependent oxidoreductase [Paenibacillus mucilaginosus]
MPNMNVTLIAGSNRTNAASTCLLRSIERLLKARQISVRFVDLSELPLPLFSPDNLELHPNAQLLLEAIADGDGLILATPEYHGSLSGTLKNALDYITAGQVAGKAVLSVSSAGGPLGVSSLSHLQSIVRNLHGINCPEWISIGAGSPAFGPDGSLSDEGMRQSVQDAVHSFVVLTGKLKAAPAAVN